MAFDIYYIYLTLCFNTFTIILAWSMRAVVFGHGIDLATRSSTKRTKQWHHEQANEPLVSSSRILSSVPGTAAVWLTQLQVEVANLNDWSIYLYFALACTNHFAILALTNKDQHKENDGSVTLPGLGLEKDMIEMLNDGSNIIAFARIKYFILNFIIELFILI